MFRILRKCDISSKNRRRRQGLEEEKRQYNVRLRSGDGRQWAICEEFSLLKFKKLLKIFQYTPKELMPVYRDLIIPLADVLTPNAFELGELTGSPIETEEDCLRAVNELHAKGVKTVVVTSGVTGAQTNESLRCYASVKGSHVYRFTFPRLVGQFVGTGQFFWFFKLKKNFACNTIFSIFQNKLEMIKSDNFSSLTHFFKHSSISRRHVHLASRRMARRTEWRCV